MVTPGSFIKSKHTHKSRVSDLNALINPTLRHSGAIFISAQCHEDVIKWKHFPRYWPFVRRIHRSAVNSTHKGQWRGALMFPLICAWINGWAKNREAGVLRRQCAHYDVIVISAECVTQYGPGQFSRNIFAIANTHRAHEDVVWCAFCETNPLKSRQFSHGISNHRHFGSFSSLHNKQHQSTILLALWVKNPPVTGRFPSQTVIRKKVSISSWWRHQMETFFRVPGPLCGEFTGYRWIPLTKASDAELWCLPWSAHEQTVDLQSRRWWYETPSRPLWRHCYVTS